MTPLCILIPGHGVKSDRYDPGAVASPLEEASLARAYVALVAAGLLAEGWRVDVLDTGPYEYRHGQAEKIRRSADNPPTVIAHCHVNSLPGQSVGLVGHLDESATGGRVAMYLAEHLCDRVPRGMAGTTRVQPYARTWRDLPSDDWRARGRYLLEPTYRASGPLGCGVLVEPWAIQAAATLDGEGLVDLLHATAGAVVAALIEWHEEEI